MRKTIIMEIIWRHCLGHVWEMLGDFLGDFQGETPRKEIKDTKRAQENRKTNLEKQ